MKEFRKLPDEDKVAQVKPLVKSYQNEIDALVKRLQFAETAFLSLYQSLIEAPDPVPLLTGAVKQVQMAEEIVPVKEENARLKQDLASTNRQVADLKMMESVNGKLQQKLQKMEQKLSEAAESSVATSDAAAQDRISFLEEREQDLLWQLSRSSEQIKALQKVTERSAPIAQKEPSRQAELDFLMRELEQWRTRAAIADREKERVQRDLDEAKRKQRLSGSTLDAVMVDWDTVESSDQQTVLRMTDKLRQCEQDIKRLTSEIESKQRLLDQQSVSSSQQTTALSMENAHLNEFLRSLQAELDARQDYHQLRQELNAFKMVEFGGDADESTSNIALEVMVMQKNKRLQADMTETRNRLQTTTEDLVQLRTKVTQYEQESATHKRLISKLEQDLLNVGTTSSPTASHALPTIPQSPAANQSLLEVITAQRDRLHQRNLELENQLRQLNSTIQALQSEVDALKDDNVKLYEKIRYVQSYRPQEVRIDAEERYGAMYEEKINPFQAFNKTV